MMRTSLFLYLCISLLAANLACSSNIYGTKADLPKEDSIPKGIALPIDDIWVDDPLPLVDGGLGLGHDVKIKIEAGRIYASTTADGIGVNYEAGMILGKNVKQTGAAEYHCEWALLGGGGKLLSFTPAVIDVLSDTSLVVRVAPTVVSVAPNTPVQFEGKKLFFRRSSVGKDAPMLHPLIKDKQHEIANSAIQTFLSHFLQPVWSDASVEAMANQMTVDAAKQYFPGKDNSSLTPSAITDIHWQFWKLENLKALHTSSPVHSEEINDLKYRKVNVSVRYYGYGTGDPNAKGEYIGGYRTLEFQLSRPNPDASWSIRRLNVVSDDRYSYAKQVWRYWLLLMLAPSILLVVIAGFYIWGAGSGVMDKPGCIATIMGWIIASFGIALVFFSGLIFEYLEKLGGDAGTAAGIGGIAVPIAMFATLAARKTFWKAFWAILALALSIGVGTVVVNRFFGSWWYIGATAFIQLLMGLAVFYRPWIALLISVSSLVGWILGFTVTNSYNGAPVVGGIIAFVAFITLVLASSRKSAKYR